MKLNIDLLKEITVGATDIVEENGAFSFIRLTKEQDRLYSETNQTFRDRSLAPAGVKFSFKTDSKNLFIKLKAEYLLPRKYFSLDVFVNGKPVGYLDNFSDIGTDNYIEQDYQVGEFSKSFDLGDGEKNVCVHLPFSVKMELSEISIDDNALVEGIKPEKKLLALGDSITQGYDALRPSNRYITNLADRMGAEEFNKAVGGDVFFPELARLKESFVPEYILVAYGTNNWTATDKETFETNCKTFFENLAESYPTSKIFALSPIWRKDHNEVKGFGPFKAIEQCIEEAVLQHENITFISGFDLIPGNEELFSDTYLHPNDKGFEYYLNNLYDRIRNEI